IWHCAMCLPLLLQYLLPPPDPSPRESRCHIRCRGTAAKPVCASNGRTYETHCFFQHARCKEPLLQITHRGRCPAIVTCQMDRARAQERKDKNGFIPECKDDGTYAQVQCHRSTGYCWCVTGEGRPISGTSVRNSLPKCSGAQKSEKQISMTSSSLKDFCYLLLTWWTSLKPSTQNKKKKHQHLRSALDESQQNPRDAIFVPECGVSGLYRPVQCHQSTGYCWCVLVDTGRPIPGTSARYERPNCDDNARTGSKLEDPFHERQLSGCPKKKTREFLMSLLDALTTDMVNAVNRKGRRFAEPNPRHSLEERVLHWYFSRLDRDGDGYVSHREARRLRRLARRKGRPRRCARRLLEFCDADGDRVLVLHELTGCLGARRSGGMSFQKIQKYKHVEVFRNTRIRAI
uniref:SPARC related modular calcium binding 1 n=1 Tax=Eptatretus burgeri TaxID=7764 RepID=A0A8C4NCJ1_EPTBU